MSSIRPLLVVAFCAAALGGAVGADIPLLDDASPTTGWSFNNGSEFPGATGGISVDDSVQPQRRPALRLEGNFTGGGNYVDLGHTLPDTDIDTLSFWLKTTGDADAITLRIIDGTGQCHQINLRIDKTDRWQHVVFPLARYFAKVGTSASVDMVTRYEGWGGAHDGKWHAPGKGIHFLVGRGSFGGALCGSFFFSGIAITPPTPKTAMNTDVYRESFESASLPSGWVATPSDALRLESDGAFDGQRFLRLGRNEDQVISGQDVALTGPVFPAAPGPWNLGAALRSNLISPDNSFTVRLHVDALDADGNLLERFTLAEQCGKANWKPLSRAVGFPAGTAGARFAAVFHKTHGTCDLDALSATPLEAASREAIVERILIDGRPAAPGGGKTTNGHLFFPGEELAFELTALSRLPLPEASRTMRVSVTDYWGAEQFDALSVPLEEAPRRDDLFAYAGRIVLPSQKLEMGKYFELHATLAPDGYADASEVSGFATLPEAEANRHDPKDIPFQIRNWDSRIREYFDLAHRIGHRNIGLWGDSGWDYVERLGADWYTGGFAVEVERNGWKNTTPEEIYRKTFELVSKHKDDRFWFICQGNEPNERPEKAREKVEAYEQVYKAAHAAKPDITVVATSVPALDCFFEAGFGKWCDVYDFHVYETYENVRQGVRRYRDMGRKYGCEKPVWCTELGLNSQGQTRYAVAQELIKKITAFFAEGGASVSWFTIQYPDPQGKARGSGGDAHNTFDCQYNLFNPRLDAIMYYAMINGVSVKKFADEVQFADGVQEYLFRDAATGECLLVAWKEGERVDRGIALPGARDIVLTRIDGSHQRLIPDSTGAVTLGLSGEPVLLSFRWDRAKLSREHARASLSIDPAQPLSILKGKSRSFRITGPGHLLAEFDVLIPPRWSYEFTQDGADVVCTVTAPAETDARTGRIMVQRRPSRTAPPAAEIVLPMPLLSSVTVETFAVPRDDQGDPGLRIVLDNHGTEAAPVRWTVELLDSWPIQSGTFRLQQPGSLRAYLRGEAEGQATLAPSGQRAVVVRIADAERQTLYRVRTTVVDAQGRRSVSERYAGGFAAAVRATGPVAIDGSGREAFWADAPAERIGITPEESYRLRNATPWRGPEDLSATWKAAWDDQNLYLLVEVTDDVYHAPFADGQLWNQDGLQFLFDPARTSAEKSGKYDYSAGVGSKGPQPWCHLTAHSSVPEGAAPWRVAEERLGGGSRRYELAIPWISLAPFQPAPGADLGMAMILNEDDGNGRIGFTGWFSGPHLKDLDHVGDLVLLP